MAYILNIDTAVKNASVSISLQGKIVSLAINNSPHDHAAFIHTAIEKVLQEAAITINEIQAVSVVYGPGSYTGLRIGMASAKGLCFALQVPLICIGTLELMTTAMSHQLPKMNYEYLLYPMIDARRMEVFTAGYNEKLEEIMPVQALILDKNCFTALPKNIIPVFFGDGADKWKTISTISNAIFPGLPALQNDFAAMSFIHFTSGNFAELAYSEPLYVKAFYTN